MTSAHFVVRFSKEVAMPEKLKDMFFTTDSIDLLADTVKKFYPEFDKSKFLNLVFNKEWESKELKEQMRHTTICLHELLPGDYKQSLEILFKVIPSIKGFDVMVFPDFVEQYGLHDWDMSLPALGYFTKFASSEFAIRPFLNEDPDSAMEFMYKWADDENKSVRRLASEGCRPRLPWAMALPKFKKDPSPILPILEKLKDDESESVRRSVSNNLNDISKDNPDIALDICKRWFGQSENVDWIVKHACRTLLKAGDKRALRLFGYADSDSIPVKNFRLENDVVKIGGELRYSLDISIDSKKPVNVRLEYGMDFVKANGKHSRKIFKIAENSYKPGSHSFARKHSFADMSTRTHYEGKHRIVLLVNGDEKASAWFDVVK